MHKLTWILVVIGGLNWLLQGIFGAEIGDWLLGGVDTWPSRIVYIVIGLAALYQIFMPGKSKSDMGGSSSMQRPA